MQIQGQPTRATVGQADEIVILAGDVRGGTAGEVAAVEGELSFGAGLAAQWEDVVDARAGGDGEAVEEFGDAGDSWKAAPVAGLPASLLLVGCREG